MTNPFAPPAPAAPAPAPAPAPANPFGQPAAPAAPQAFAPPQAPPAAPAPAPQAFGNPGAQGSSAWPVGATRALPTSIGQAARPQPASTGGRDGADLTAMYGRLVLIFPRSIERGVPSKFTYPMNHPDVNLRGKPQLQNRMTATFVVLDDPRGRPGEAPSISWGGDPYNMQNPTPHTKTEPLPHVSRDLWISQAQLVKQCAEALALTQAGGVGMVLGRLVRAGNEPNSPWVIQDYTEAETAIADYYLAAVNAGTYPNPLAA